MYIITEELKEIIGKFKTIYLQEALGLTNVHIYNILNGKQSCTELIAKAILSICFNIPINDIKMPDLIEKYFTTKE